MKQILQLIVKSLLILTAVALVFLLVVGVVLLLDWPWWTGIFVGLFFVGLGIGVVFLFKMVKRRKEQQFVDQIVSQDEMQLKAMAAKERDESQLLQTQWKEAIDTLKKSHLKKLGNPLYVLPWYLVIGESASGKTTAIKSARLSSPFAQGSKVSGISGTRNCDWWFFEQAIIIDTAGRYAIRVDEGRDKDEWQKFLSLLAKFRKKESLNGLIVTIPADKLLEGSSETIDQEGLQIRNRIDEIMLSIGSKFPVYVMVTKCDLIKGMTQFSEKLPEKVLDQAMGVLNPNLVKVSPDFWGNAVDSITERLSNLLLQVLHDRADKKVDPALILFPSEFERVRQGLDTFMAKAFQDNPYQETPILRGLFFTSGCQEGTPYSHFLNKLGLIGEQEVLPGTNRGLFLHDFFAKILPTDRGIFAPTRRTLEWRRLSRNLGLTSWIAVVVALCGLMSFSFVKNLRTMREVPKEFIEAPIIQGDLLLDVVTLDRYQQAILKVEATNQNWWIPRFGLRESIEVEEYLKENFSRQFKNSFLGPMDKRMEGRMSEFNLATSDQMISRHVSHLVRRINLLQKRMKTRDKLILSDMPQVPFLAMLPPEQLNLIPEIRKKMASMYLYYLLWNSDDSQMNLEMNALKSWLKHTLAAKGNQLDWLVIWANEQESLSPVLLADFWGGSKALDGAVSVTPAFTEMGKEHIGAFIQELENALPDPGVTLIARQKIEFSEMYRTTFLAAWHTFAEKFEQGATRLNSYEEWLPMAQKVTSLSGPYITLLDTMVKELASVAETAKKDPSWVKLINEHQILWGQAQVLAKSEKGALLSRASTKTSQLVDKLERKLDAAGAGNNLENQMQAASALRDYQRALKETMSLLAPRKTAFNTARAVFNDEQSSMGTAMQATARLRTYMTSGKDDEAVYWSLINGPMEFLWQFERTEAACYLQDRWEKDVLAEIQGINDQQKVLQLLLDHDGYAMQFIKGAAEPFISRNPKKGYYAATVLDGSLPLDSAFLNFLTRGISAKRTARPHYDVSIKGVPTGVNPEAQIKPHATHVELQCAGDTLKLSNFQFPTRKSFRWSQESCGDVLFEIEVGDMHLTKKYSGNQAFPKFLSDFKTGQKTFYPGDFRDHKDDLQRLGI